MSTNTEALLQVIPGLYPVMAFPHLVPDLILSPHHVYVPDLVLAPDLVLDPDLVPPLVLVPFLDVVPAPHLVLYHDLVSSLLFLHMILLPAPNLVRSP